LLGIKDGLKGRRSRSLGLLRKVDGLVFVLGLGRIEGEIATLEECLEPVVVRLMVVLDQGMVVALAALQVTAKEYAAHIASQQVRIAVALQVELHRGAGFGVGSVSGQNLASQLIVGLVGEERLKEIAFPVDLLDSFSVSALEQHHIE